MKNVMRFVLVFVVVGVVACGGGNTNNPVVRDLTETEQKLVESSNRFGFKLLSEVVGQSDGGNVFISPLSVSLALGMTYNGTAGTTEEGMRATLEFGDLTREEINQGYRDLIEMLCNLDPKVQMEIANSIWYRQGFDVLQSFVDTMTTFFDALVTAVDFSDPGTKDVINEWVAEKTHDKIKEIIKETYADMVMILINAIYFKGTWTYEFDPEDTSDGTFHAPDGDKTVKMMHMHGELSYQENADFQAVDLPYGHELFSMTVFLPKGDKSVDDLVAMLTDENWAAWMGGFNVEVKHKTYVKVNEEGTEAAAGTSVTIVDTAAGPFMSVDRPFLFVIHDKNSKAMMFMGKIVDPPSA